MLARSLVCVPLLAHVLIEFQEDHSVRRSPFQHLCCMTLSSCAFFFPRRGALFFSVCASLSLAFQIRVSPVDAARNLKDGAYLVDLREADAIAEVQATVDIPGSNVLYIPFSGIHIPLTHEPRVPLNFARRLESGEPDPQG
jgi:hypothetical protein